MAPITRAFTRLAGRGVAFNQHLAALSAQCPGGVVPPHLADEGDRLADERVNITDAIGYGHRLAEQAAERAAVVFNRAATLSPADVGRVDGFTDAGFSPRQAATVVFPELGLAIGAATTGTPA